MAKTNLTKELEKRIYKATSKQGVFCCFEVTIGWFGTERVDYITYDTNDVWRCYEIKVTKSDFHSKAHTTFVGNYNYYVMPEKLYEQVKSEIPDHVGVYVGEKCVKRAKRQELSVDSQILKNSLIRSLSRDSEALMKLNDPNYINKLKTRIKKLESENQKIRRKYFDLYYQYKKICMKNGEEPSFNLDNDLFD